MAFPFNQLKAYWDLDGNSKDAVGSNNGTDTAIAYTTPVDSYSGSLQGSNGVSSGGYIYIGNTFHVTNADRLSYCKFHLSHLNSPTGYLYAKIYAITGTPGTNAVPTGSALATSEAIDASTVSQTDQPPATEYTFIFTGANKISLSANTNYAVILYFNATGSGSDILYTATHYPNEITGNYITSTNGSSWAADVNRNMLFKVYGDLSGRINIGAYFNGSSSTITASGTTIPTNASIQCWIKTKLASGNYPLFGFNGGAYMAFWVSGGLYISAHLKDSNNNEGWCGGSKQLNDGNWHHLVLVKTGSKIELFIDGESDGSDNTVTYTGNFTASGITFAPAGYPGMMDECAYWEKALSQAEITELYNSGNGLAHPVPAIYANYTVTPDDQEAIYGVVLAGESFTPSITHVIKKAILKLYRVGSPGTGTLTIYAADANHKPTGSALCSGTIDGNSITTDTAGVEYEIRLGDGATLNASTEYVMVLSASSGSTNNWFRWKEVVTGTYSGTMVTSSDNGANWTAQTYDFYFKEFGIPTTKELEHYDNIGNSDQTVVYGSANWKAQTFTPVRTHTIKMVSLRLNGVGSPGTMNVGIYATDANGKPTGSALASGSMSGSIVTGVAAGEFYIIDLGAGYHLTAGTKYAIVISLPTGDASNYLRWKQESSNYPSGVPNYPGGGAGNLSSGDSGSTWTVVTGGCVLLFQEWGTTETTYNEAVNSSATATAINIKSITKPYKATAKALATAIKQTTKSFKASAKATALIIKQFSVNAFTSVVASVSVGTIRVILLDIASAVVGTATLGSLQIQKLSKATVTVTITTARAISKESKATVEATATIVKSFIMTLKASTKATATTCRAFVSNISAQVVATATILQQAGRDIVAQVIASVSVAAAKIKTISASVTASVTMSKSISKIASATPVVRAKIIDMFYKIKYLFQGDDYTKKY